ncbi:class I SAM-dependent methyltransferase [uncultured Flavobacterium sp.]|uniref:class I SAM-dependent methyltransferase n=1 Tax=uncultured Flavobacterium sp. TaxID=165435 RepID=UPI0025FFE038|nr:class I SAM-dependent methyltransferase [uncultured Flavobacterium sp.]
MGNLTEQELQELASQLSHPKGENGIATAKSMNVANDNMIQNVIAQIDLKDNSKILEIGPGNGLHIKYLFDKNASINYTGIDISELMIEEATNLNSEFTISGKAVFELTNSEIIDKEDNSIDAIFTVNTLYFWKNAKEYLQEIFRVLNSEGQFILGFIPKSTMEKIPFSKYGFELYDNKSVIDLLEEMGFKIGKTLSETEEVLSNTGDKKIRTFTVIKALKF